MSVRRLSISLLAAVLVAGTLLGGHAVPSAKADDPTLAEAIAQQQRMEAELARQRSTLASLNRRQVSLNDSLRRIAADLESVGLQIETTAAELERVTAELEQTRVELQGYRDRIARLSADLDLVQAQIIEARRELIAREQLLQDHLRVAYEQSRTTLLEVLLSAESLDRAAGQVGYLLTLSDEDRRLADEIRKTREQLKVRQQTLREGRRTLRELERITAQREAELAEQQALVDELKHQLEAQQAQLEAYHAEQEANLAATVATQQQVAELVRRQGEAVAAHNQLVERLKEEARKLDIAYRGRFAWPERGSVIITQEFGHTSFSAFHNGIDMTYTSPGCGGRIYAAGDGVVLADGRPAAPADSAIGVIIGHSQRLQTWYWHMSSEVVSVGQQVTTGQLIGYEGSTGWSTGCHLHLEVRLDGSPVNPRLYLP